jgi:hypothetical protein
MSDTPSHDGNDIAVAEGNRVTSWRTQNLFQYDLDFAHVFEDFEQAYSQAIRAVAVARDVLGSCQNLEGMKQDLLQSKPLLLRFARLTVRRKETADKQI